FRKGVLDQVLQHEILEPGWRVLGMNENEADRRANALQDPDLLETRDLWDVAPYSPGWNQSPAEIPSSDADPETEEDPSRDPFTDLTADTALSMELTISDVERLKRGARVKMGIHKVVIESVAESPRTGPGFVVIRAHVDTPLANQVTRFISPSAKKTGIYS